jgi:hypothetical protein
MVAAGSLLVAGLAGAQNAQYQPVINAFAGGATAVCAAATDAIGDGCPATQSIVNTPYSGASDAAGNYYFPDLVSSSANSSRIRRVDARTGIITTVAGGATAVCAAATNTIGDGCPATQAFLYGTRAVAFNPRGDMYIADTSNSSVRMVDATTGIITTVLGTGVAGNGPFNNTTGTAGSATKVSNVIGIAFDQAGNLYVSQSNQYYVLLELAGSNGQVTASSKVYTLAGTGSKGFLDGPSSTAQLNSARGIALDLQGNVYLADTSNYRVRKITTPFVAGVLTLSASVTSTVAGNGGTGSTGDGGPATAAQIGNVETVAVDAYGNVYEQQASSPYSFVRRIDAVTGTITKVVGTGAYGTTGDGGLASAATFSSGFGLAIDTYGNLMMSDTGNNRVRQISVGGQFPATAVYGSSTPQSLYVGVNAALTPTSDAVTAGFPDFTAATMVGCTVGTLAAAGASCQTQVTFRPSAVGYLTAPLVLADSTNAQYVTGLSGIGTAGRLSFSPAAIKTVAGTGSLGYLGDGAAATAARVSGPRDGAMDAAGNIYFADAGNNVVRKISASNGFISTVAGNGTAGFAGDGAAATAGMLQAPSAVVLDAAGNLFVADTGNNRIRMVSAATGVISTVAGGATAGYSGDNGLASVALLNKPQGLAVDELGGIVFADTGNHAVRRLVPATGLMATLAGTGTAGYSGDGGLATAAKLSSPAGVTVDDAGNVYVADTGNNVVRKFLPGGAISTVAGVQTLSANSGDGGLATAAGLLTPTDVVTDASGDLYVMAGTQVRMVDASGRIATIAGAAGTGSYGGDGASATAVVLGGQAMNLFKDKQGNVYLSETAANRVLEVTQAAAPSLSFAGQVVGGTGPSQVVTVTNTGNQAVTFAGDAVSTGFKQLVSGGVDCSATTVLAVGASCKVSVAFAPGSAGAQTGSVTLTTNALNSTTVQTIPLSGNGLGAIGTTPQTISFPALSDVTYGAAAVTLNATSTSGLPVSYSVTGATLSGTTVVITGAGVVTVTATQAGNATYASATPVVRSFTVNKATLTYTADNLTKLVGDPVPTLTYTRSALVAGDPASVVTGAPVLATTATATSPAGSYPVTITQGTLAAANYNFVFVNGSLLVQTADFTLTASPTTITMSPGQVGLVNLTLTPLFKYAGTVTLSCGSVPANVSCVFLPRTLVGSGGTAVTTGSLSITSVANLAGHREREGGREIVFAGLLLGVAFVARKRKLLGRGLLLVALLAGVMTTSGCVTQSRYVAGTGTSQIVVTGTDAANNLTHAVTITLTLQ